MTLALRYLVALLLLALVLVTPTQQTSRVRSLVGFPGSATTEELALEERFADSLDADNLRGWLKELTARPHHTGSIAGRETAESIAAKFRSWGYETEIETFYALMSTPKKRLVEMVAPHTYVASLTEKETAGLPPYNVFSRDGDVLAKAVYANYGLQDDYDVLSQHRIDVEGKIVIARYGRAFRAIKPRLAAERGAVGVILFSDPAETGFARGATYPDGPFLPMDGVQRGSVMDLTRYAGDPLTPGRGATRRPAEFSLAEASSVLSPVPVLPLSAGDMQPILAAMRGPVAPPEWQGALPITYRLSGDVTLRLEVRQEWDIVPLHNVVARLEGSTWPDEWVLRGNNHDAWNYGAMVAGSGLVSMMEEARAIAALARKGWWPRRTILYLAWDGEEQGLMGSTEWVETYADLLQERAVAYLNTGVTTRDVFTASGSHALESLVDDIARVARDSRHGLDALARRKIDRDERGGPEPRTVRLEALGLGSDFTPFLQHLGIPSLDYSFDGGVESGVYHSIYDNFDFYDRFGDPGFVYGKMLTELSGRTMMRLANADILPFDFSGMSDALEGYLAEIEALVKGKPASISLDFRVVAGACERLARAAARFNRERAAYEASGMSLSDSQLAGLNRILRRAEQQLAPTDGLPGRPWYRHQVYAPGSKTGYASKTLPAIREAVEQEEWEQARLQIERVAGTIDDYARQIDRAAEIPRQTESQK